MKEIIERVNSLPKHKLFIRCFGIGVIGGIFLMMFNQETWNNVWNIFAGTTGAGIGGYIAYRIAKNQSKEDRDANIKSLFLEMDIRACANSIEALHAIRLDSAMLLNYLYEAMYAYAYDSPNALSTAREYDRKSREFNLVHRNNVREIRTSLITVGINFDLSAVNKVNDRHKKIIENINIDEAGGWNPSDIDILMEHIAEIGLESNEFAQQSDSLQKTLENTISLLRTNAMK